MTTFTCVSAKMTDGELVQAHPLDEVRRGVDEGDLRVHGAETAREHAGGDGAGVAGAEDEDAVRHGEPPVSG
ncbi:MAG: hypothetical protein ACTMII_12595 [Brachybacterium sp.]